MLLNPSNSSTASTDVNLPEVTGVPLVTTHPSYFQPSGNVGKLKPTAGAPDDKSKNQTPLFSSLSAPFVGVANIYFPFAVEKLFVKAAPCPIESCPELPEKSPAKI